MKDLKKQILQIREDFFAELKKGNFTLSEMRLLDSLSVRVTLTVGGIAQRCSVLLEFNRFLFHSIQKTGISLFQDEAFDVPEKLAEAIQTKMFENRLDLILDYNSLSKSSCDECF